MLLGPTRVKAARKMLKKLTPASHRQDSQKTDQKKRRHVNEYLLILQV